MSKLQSLQRLRDLGLNTPRLICSLQQYLSPKNKLSFWDSVDTPQDVRVSIRTERDGELICPHFPNITRRDANKYISKLAHQGYSIYIFEGINPLDCMRRGNIALFKDRIIVEFLEGPGTVRDLEKAVPIHLDLKSWTELPISLRYLSYGLESQELWNQIIEWSIYKDPVGQLGRMDIYWEIRPWH
jgi:hypothetical protein